MSRYLLYYAGMADDKVAEQIGLAVSDDGINFARVNGTGLVLGRDGAVEWRSLRVCNPTVLPEDGGYVMYYQGIAGGPGPAHTSIGVARSRDGVSWTPDAEPIVPWQAMAAHDPLLDAGSRVNAIEPSVLHHDGRRRMWFVYRHASTPGNAIFHAEQEPGGSWAIGPRVLSGADFPGLHVHYPQVTTDGDSLVLYVTMRDDRHLYGIYRLRSADDGLTWGEAEPVLPPARSLTPSLRLRVLWHLPERIRYRVLSGRLALGVAHGHLLGDGETMYYHGVNAGPRGLWHDIRRCELDRGTWRRHRLVLEPAPDPTAWDSFFVADPFVVAA